MSASASILLRNSPLLTTVPPPSASGNVSTRGETSPSFEDVLQENGGAPIPVSTMKAQVPAITKTALERMASLVTPSSDAGPTPDASGSTGAPVGPTATPTAPAKLNPVPLAAGTDLSAMIVQAAVLASNARQILAPGTPVSTAPGKSEENAGSAKDTAKNPSPKVPDALALVATAAPSSILPSSVKPAAAPQTPSVKPGRGSGSNTPSANILPSRVTDGTDLSTLTAQSLMPAANASVGQRQEIPPFSLSSAGSGSAVKEKKSPVPGAEGSFIQPVAAASHLTLDPAHLLSFGPGVTPESLVNQQLTAVVGPRNQTFIDSGAGISAIAGTANVKKGKAMNDDLNISEVELLSDFAANTPPGSGTADLRIQLSSNNDFSDALKQVMHVAELTQTNESRTPMRVAMEIQTPPGAIVNVYVSRQNDQWRAQLSTNDPQALSWVQNQVTSLRQSNDIGVEVKWLPPQMESGPAPSGGQDSNLSWDRGGQGQSNYQQPDERPQSGRQKKADAAPALTVIQSDEFMSTLAALGRAA